jgi:hypothetical protein
MRCDAMRVSTETPMGWDVRGGRREERDEWISRLKRSAVLVWNHQSYWNMCVCADFAVGQCSPYSLSKKKKGLLLPKVRSHSLDSSTFSLIQLSCSMNEKKMQCLLPVYCSLTKSFSSISPHLLALICILFFRPHADAQASKEYQQQENQYQQQQDLYPVQNCYGLGQDPHPRLVG